MALEPQLPNGNVWKDEKDLSTTNSPEIVSSWCEQLEGQYTLYEFLPAVSELPAIHALTTEDRYVEKESGEFSTSEHLLQIGVIDLEPPEPPNHLCDKAKEIVDTPGLRMRDPVAALERHILDEITAEQFTALHGNRLTVTIPPEIFDEENECYENIGDWSTIQHLFEVLVESDDYPMAATDEEFTYEYQVRIKLDHISDVLDAPGVRKQFTEAIDNYQNGVFANKPSMAITHALHTHRQNTSQREIADIIGIDASTVSHQLTSAETWINRAMHTASKYDE